MQGKGYMKVKTGGERKKKKEKERKERERKKVMSFFEEIGR